MRSRVDGGQYVVIVLDGAADLYRADGRSPLALASMDHADWLARRGATGLMQTLYPDLPRESLVAQLGMLGWDPHVYYPNGRASCELLAVTDIQLRDADLALRANFVRMDGTMLASYNADYIASDIARALVDRLNHSLRGEFPEFELYHNSDFRNTLVIRNAGVGAQSFRCCEPHESEGKHLDFHDLVTSVDRAGRTVAMRVNGYATRVAELLRGHAANAIVPWSASGVLRLPPFRTHVTIDGRMAVVGAMDFLHGLAKAGGLEFYKVGDGSPTTDYAGKGRQVVQLLVDGYELVVCHINGPDEASHMHDLALKIHSLRMADRLVIGPLVEYFLAHPERLAAMMILPDHYSNAFDAVPPQKRIDSHSLHPVPFALWNGRDRDETSAFTEDAARLGRFGAPPMSHLDLLSLLGVAAHSPGVRVPDDRP